MRPIHHALRMSVFYGIEVDVIHVPLQIDFIANLMLPKPPLPYALFAFGDLARRTLGSGQAA